MIRYLNLEMIDVELSSPPQQVSAGGARAGPGRAADHDDADRPDRGVPLHRDPLHGHHRPTRPLHKVSPILSSIQSYQISNMLCTLLNEPTVSRLEMWSPT